MQAKMGDWLVIKGPATAQGLITEVRSPDGSPPYVVRWLDTGRVAMVFPGPDAVVVTADEQQVADELTQSRVAAVQAAIAHHTVSA
jgi:Domain of unknown function (DUF1918)